MSLETIALNNIGVEVRGFDITQPVDDDMQQTLSALWDQHGVLVFRDQDVTPERQIAFSRVFGPLVSHPIEETTSHEYPELFMLASNPEQEKFLTASYNGQTKVSKLDWHMDLHYTGKPNRGAILRAVVCAEEDGLTGFGDLAKAYSALDEETKALLEQIEVTYAFSMQRKHMRYVDLKGYEPGPYSPRKPSDINYPNFPEIAYPAVVTHPITGDKILEICEQFLERIVTPHNAGLSNDEAIELLERLVAHTRKEEFHYFHEWRQGDMVLWDNWRAMHCATGTRPGVERVIHRTTIAGEETLGRVVGE